MQPIKIAIADDHRLFREGLKMILDRIEDFILCFEAVSGQDLLTRMKAKSVDVVLLDIDMKDMNGIEALRKIILRNPRPRIIILSMHMELRLISHLMELGASSYLPKDVKKEELEKAIRTVHSEGVYLNDTITKSMLTTLKTKGKKFTLNVELRDREKEVLQLICKELTTKEIAKIMHLSERTVEGHRQNLMHKLDTKTTVGLLKKAISLNLFSDLE